MVVKERVDEAPKKRGRPKGSKNKAVGVAEKREKTISGDVEKDEDETEGKTRRKTKKASDQETGKLKKNKTAKASSEMIDSLNVNSQVHFSQDILKSDDSRQVEESGDLEQSTGLHSKKKNTKQNIRKNTVEKKLSEKKMAKSEEESVSTAMVAEVESRTETEDGLNSSGLVKKATDARKKRRKPSTTYVNSIVGMVKYDENLNAREMPEPEVVAEEEEEGFETEIETPEPAKEPNGIKVEGIFELSDQSGATYGFLRQNGISSEDDIYVSPMFVKKFNLKSGELVRGYARLEQTDRHRPLTFVADVNGVPPYTTRSKCKFDDMTPQFPKERFHLSMSTNDIAMRIIDLIAPVGKGQRGLIVAPPKSGKTILLQKIAKSIKRNYPEVELMILLIDERPEEVTDMKEEVDAAVYYSTFDELPMNHIRIAELVLNRARGLVEMGRDVVILLDSITRLARAYNIAMPASGRTLSGGLDTSALHKPKRFLGSARNMIEGGSLTIMATALIETGSKMDDVIFEEFKGTGNMELILDRKLSEKRIFPSIDIKRSGTRREELLLNREEYEAIMKLRRALDQTSGNEPVELLSEELMRTKDNAELIAWINKVFVDSKFGKVR